MWSVGSGTEEQGLQNLVFNYLHLSLLISPECLHIHVIPVSGSHHIPLWIPLSDPKTSSSLLTHILSLSTFVPFLKTHNALAAFWSPFVQQETLNLLSQVLSIPGLSDTVFVATLVFWLWWHGQFLRKFYLFFQFSRWEASPNQLFCLTLLQTHHTQTVVVLSPPTTSC